jgi:hypothetical protein
MSEPDKLQTATISSADLRRRGAILRNLANAFDAVGAQMDNNFVGPIEMKGQATFERAVAYLRGSVNTAQSAVLEKITGMVVDIAIEQPEIAAQQIAEKVKPTKKPKR